VSPRRDAVIAAVGGVVLFLVCSLVATGGLLASHPYGDVHLYAHYAHNMSQGRLPYRNFFDEYPPLAQPLFYVVRLLPGTYQPAFRWTMAVFGATALVLMIAALASAGAPRRRLAVAAVTIGVAPVVVGPIFLNEYDMWPAMLVAGAILAFIRRHERLAYVLLALGVAAKIYPLVLLPLALVETWDRGGRELVKRVLLWFVGVLFLVHLPFAILGPGGLRFSYWVNIKRGLEVESLGGAVLLVLDRAGLYHATLREGAPGSTNITGSVANAVGSLGSLVVIAAVLLVAWLWQRRRGSPFVATGAAVLAFVAFGKVFSPQYVEWLTPLLPAAGFVGAGGMLGVLALTHVVFDRFQTPAATADAYKAALTPWVVGRDLLVVLLYALFVLRLWRRPTSKIP
jgi:Glycosyltransferase family 87